MTDRIKPKDGSWAYSWSGEGGFLPAGETRESATAMLGGESGWIGRVKYPSAARAIPDLDTIIDQMDESMYDDPENWAPEDCGVDQEAGAAEAWKALTAKFSAEYLICDWWFVDLVEEVTDD